MDTTLTLVDVLIAASVILPIIALIIVGNSPKRKLYKQFKALAAKNSLTISDKEFWSNAFIGIDRTKNILLFMRTVKDSVEEELIDLTTIKECKVNSLTRSIKTKQKKENILEQVDLQFYFLGNNAAMKSLDFYDHNRIYSEDFEVMRAEKWKNIVQGQLSSDTALAMAV